MKKIITFMLIMVIAVSVFAVSASAAALNENEQRIVDAVSQKITVAGKEVALESAWINQAKNYMLRDDVDLTKEQAGNLTALEF